MIEITIQDGPAPNSVRAQRREAYGAVTNALRKIEVGQWFAVDAAPNANGAVTRSRINGALTRVGAERPDIRFRTAFDKETRRLIVWCESRFGA